MQKCRSKCTWEWGCIFLGSISEIKVSTECRNEGTNSKSYLLEFGMNIYFNYKFFSLNLRFSFFLFQRNSVRVSSFILNILTIQKNSQGKYTSIKRKSRVCILNLLPRKIYFLVITVKIDFQYVFSIY